MRIFYASDSTPNSFFQSNLWRNNLYLPMLDLGHDVVEFDYDFRETFQNLDPRDPVQKKFIDHNRPRLSGALLEQVRQAHEQKNIDLFFSYLYDACITPEVIQAIRDLGIKTVNWYCNGAYQLELVSEISPHYDWCLVPEKFRMKDYKAMAANPIYCQEAANPKIYHPHPVSQDYDVTFVGQCYGERPYFVQYLLNQGVPVRVWGWGWAEKAEGNRWLKQLVKLKTKLRHPRQMAMQLSRHLYRRLTKRSVEGRTGAHGLHDPYFRDLKIQIPPRLVGPVLSDEELVKMYSRSKINLGFSSCGETHREGERIVQIRLRDFEVPMSGGFYLVEYMEELEEFFEIEKEISCYRDPEELADKIRYYLKNEDEREKVRRAGYERCLKDHTWHRRFENVFREMGLEGPQSEQEARILGNSGGERCNVERV